MLRYIAAVVIGLIAAGAWAQQAPAPTATPPDATATSAPPEKAVVAMEEPLPGDHWTYEIRDEITGNITGTREHIVTEVTPTAISVKFVRPGGSNNEGFAIYDRSWNKVEERPWRYSPHDGTGIQSPLAVGKTWPVQTNNINGANGRVWRRSGISKVVAEESVTTKAGTFNTFKIETRFKGRNVSDPTMVNEVTSLTWYAPAIDHWVRRTFVSRANTHLQIDNAVELIEYGRRQ